MPFPAHHNSTHRSGLSRLGFCCAAFLLLLTLFVPSANAQPNPSTDEMLTINMRDADIGAVIQWIAEQTNKNIVVDPRVKGNVTVLANEPMTVAQAYQVFLTMLDVYGYAATDTDGILRIFPAGQSRTTPKNLIKEFQALGGGEHILYVYRAKNVSSNRLVDLLRPLIPAGGHIAAFPENNSFIIADESENIKRLIALVSQIDNSGNLDIDVIKLQHASASDVSGLVQSLIAKETGAPFSIASDPRSNSVLMSGDKVTRQRVAQLVAQLDRPITNSGSTRVVYLHYLDAAELVPILRGMSTAMQTDSSTETVGKATISIEASESSNALIMTAPPGILDMMSDVIAQVDIRRAQVLVEAIIVEVSKDFSQTIGVEWNTSFSNSDGTEAITNFGIRTPNQDGEVSLLGAGLSLGFFRNGSLRVLAQAIANENDANILSTPSILTLDNQEAEILVGSNVPFITGQSTGSSSSTDNPFTTIQREDIGVTLKITPKINEGDAITLDILQEIETISPASIVANDIVTNKRSIKTKVLVEDETILVLGGLVSDDTQELVNKVPLLGDIPVLGALFRSTTTKIVKKNLMVFIHPVIVDSEKIAENVTRKNYGLMRELQEKYNAGKFTVDKNELKDFTEYKPRKALEQ